MKKLLLFIMALCTFNEQQACSRRVKNKLQEVIDNCSQVEYQRTILKSITTGTAAVGVKGFHMFVPQCMGLNSPLVATVLTQFLDTLPGLTTQGVLLKQALAKRVTPQSIGRAIELGVYTAFVLLCEERLILLVLPPNSLATATAFLGISATTVPTFTMWTLSYANDLKTKLKTFFGCGRKHRSSEDDVVLINVFPVEHREKE